ncbi:MAG: hypothetical protein NTV00_04815 [Methylococcales bacterium]|nr:hypothetical protein [Methylococcales bacterium]
MKSILFVALLLSSTLAFAEKTTEKPKEEWQNTTLTEATIKKIQAAKQKYNQCIATEMQKMDHEKVDTRTSTEAIIKKCEPILGDMRKVYVDEKIPDIIADRHLKQIRIQTTRGVLQQMMYVEAARASGQVTAPLPAK